MEYYIIVYKNTYDAMVAEQKLKELNFKFRIMPTPTSITQSCGICTRFDSKDEVEEVMNKKLLEYKSIYHKNSEGFKEIGK